MAPYAASKAALKFFNDSLRVEMRPYGVEVVNFIPGSFVMSSNITARQQEYANEQLQAFSDEQLRFYGEYFHRYANYLKFISGRKSAHIMSDEGLLFMFEAALLENGPKSVYKYEPLRYQSYLFINSNFSITV